MDDNNPEASESTFSPLTGEPKRRSPSPEHQTECAIISNASISANDEFRAVEDMETAISTGDTEKIIEMIEKYNQDPENSIVFLCRCETPVYLAYALKKKEIVKLLLPIEAARNPLVLDIGKKQYCQVNPIGLAVLNEDIEFLNLFLLYDEFTPERILEGNTPLCNAIGKNNPDIVKILLEDPRTNPNTMHEERPLTIACKNGYLSIAKLLIEHPKCDINAQPYALTMAALLEHKEIVKLLLLQKDRIDVNVVQNQKTCLYYACFQGDLELVKMLLEFDQLDLNTFCPLGIACTKNYFEIFKLLILDPRCDPNVKNNYDQTVLQHACANGKFEYVELLLQHPSISFEVPQTEYISILCAACQNGNLDIINALLSDSRLGTLTKETIKDCLLRCRRRRNNLQIGARLIGESGFSPLELLENDHPEFGQRLKVFCASRKKSARK